MNKNDLIGLLADFEENRASGFDQLMDRFGFGRDAEGSLSINHEGTKITLLYHGLYKPGDGRELKLIAIVKAPIVKDCISRSEIVIRHEAEKLNFEIKPQPLNAANLTEILKDLGNYHAVLNTYFREI